MKSDTLSKLVHAEAQLRYVLSCTEPLPLGIAARCAIDAMDRAIREYYESNKSDKNE